MTNGRVEIHDLFSSSRSQNEGMEEGMDGMDESVEFRIMMAFAKRRRPEQEEEKSDGGDSKDANGTTTPVPTPEKKKKKKKKGWKRLPGFLRCVKPQTKDPESQQTPPHNFRSLNPAADDRLELNSAEPVEDKEDKDDKDDKYDKEDKFDGLSEAVSRLTEIADEIPFSPPDWETDSPPEQVCDPDEVEKLIGLILRDAGDRLNEKELKDADISAELFWNYSFFRQLINKLLMRMGLRSPEPDALGPQASPKTQIAVTCEVTSRLSQLNSLPRNLLMRHGARYLQDYYSMWAQQQGGYEAAFEGDEDEVE